MDKVYDNGGIIGLSRNPADNVKYVQSGSLSEPQYVGGYTAVLGSTPLSYTITLTSLAGGLATSPSIDDIVVLAFGHADRVDRDLSVTTSSYTELAQGYVNNTSSLGQDLNYYIGYKVLTSTDTEIVVGNGVAISGRPSVYGVHVWRNIDTANPIDTGISINTVTNTGPRPTLPALTLTNRNSIVVGVGIGTMANTVAGDFSTFFLGNFIENSVVSTSSGTIIGIGSKPWNNNNQNPVVLGTFTYTTTQASANVSIGASFALKAKDTRVFGNNKNSGVWSLKQQKSIEYVGGFTYATLPTTNTNILTVTLTSLYGGSGTAPQVGDMVIAAVYHGVNIIPTVSSATTVSDYVVLATTTRLDGGNTAIALGASISYKILTSTDTQFIVNRQTGFAARGCIVGVQVWRNLNNTPIDINSIIAGDDDGITNLADRRPLTPGAIISYVAGRSSTTLQLDQIYSHPYFDNLGSLTVVAATTDVTFAMASEYTKDIYFATNFSHSQESSIFQLSMAAAVTLRPQNNQIRDLNNIKNSIYRFGQ